MLHGMDCFICHTSACRAYRDPEIIAALEPTCASPHGRHSPAASLRDMRKFDALRNGDGKLDLCVHNARRRGSAAAFAYHVWNGPAGFDSFRKLKGLDGIYVSSPEACFLQMAACLDLLDLITLGFELCGSYCIANTHARTLLDRAPLTDTKTLHAYLSHAQGIRGNARAKRALSYMKDGSASPRETALALLFGLPSNLGGFGLKLPEMNHAVTVGIGRSEQGGDAGVHGKRTYHYDLYWPRYDIAIEYQSTRHHAKEHELTRDSKRFNDLELRETTLFTITNRQADDFIELERLAHRIARCAGARIRPDDPPARSKRIKLWKRLFRVSG